MEKHAPVLLFLIISFSLFLSFTFLGVIAFLFYEKLHASLNLVYLCAFHSHITCRNIFQQRHIWSRMLKATEQYFSLLSDVLCLALLSLIDCLCVTWWRVLRVILRRSLRLQSWQPASCLAKSERLNNVDRRGWSGTKHIILKASLTNNRLHRESTDPSKDNSSESWDTLKRRQ